MKILIPPSDLHIDEKAPLHRIDDYYNKQFTKLNYCIDLGNKHKCDMMLQSGDFFNFSHDRVNYDLKSKKFQIKRITFETIAKTIKLLSKFKGKCFSVAGNHDQRNRMTSLENTPLKVLYSSGVITQLNNTDPIIIDRNINIYGMNYNDEIPIIKNSDSFNILVAHIMVIKDKLWKQQEEYENASIFLRKNKFDVIVSGDNHQSFDHHYGNKHLFNLGSLMRMNSKQLDHKPRCVIFDTKTRECESFDIPIDPSSEVFSIQEIEDERNKKIDNEKIKDYYNSLLNEDKTTIKFEDNMETYLEENKISKVHSDIIYKNMGLR
ncbi:MAG: hypothetical protein GQ540_03860 [Lutibacter sp.]|uniref:metallophosphoesterase family protein n=1 Tax=Lutibacter sp. TaxID=1925666 RepID=UPI0019FA6362|nr:metallophosphoesterase [Lutibacter sp.]NOR27649.1 hypothetical protein [Lutibacter sp.]